MKTKTAMYTDPQIVGNMRWTSLLICCSYTIILQIIFTLSYNMVDCIVHPKQLYVLWPTLKYNKSILNWFWRGKKSVLFVDPTPSREQTAVSLHPFSVHTGTTYVFTQCYCAGVKHWNKAGCEAKCFWRMELLLRSWSSLYFLYFMLD